MCGILGTVNTGFNSSELNLIAHRGPDDCGIEQFEINSNSIQFGHRRLSIIDLSAAGHQPLTSTCGNYSIIYNGEVYNHIELRKKLLGAIKYKGYSDTESLLYYLIEYGVNGIKDFNGIFSFAFLDKVNNKLLLVRDPFGVKPLYYFHKGKSFIFSSEIRPIVALMNDAYLDKEALGTLLRLRYNPAPDTIYKGINKVQPGHYIEVKLDEKNIVVNNEPYIDTVPNKINLSFADATKEYGEKLEEAISAQLLSDVEVGVLLSGGLDSAVVAALAKKHIKGKLKAFTIGFKGAYNEDEVKDAAETADILKLEHYYKKISFDDFLTTIKECTKIIEEPLATTSMIPMYYLSELASKHVKVVLSGQGADEPLGGYAKYKAELLRSRIPNFIKSSLRTLINLTKTQNQKLIRASNALVIKNETERFLALGEVFNCTEIEQLISVRDELSHYRIDYFHNLLNCQSLNTSAEKLMALDLRLNLSDDLLNYTDKITMHFGLECRVPMLDLRLIQFIESLPLNHKLKISSGKIIHKEYARTLLPERIIQRKKRGFESPTNTWFRNEIGTLKDILLSKSSNFSQEFNLETVKNILNQHVKGANRERHIFLLLSLYFWMESNL